MRDFFFFFKQPFTVSAAQLFNIREEFAALFPSFQVSFYKRSLQLLFQLKVSVFFFKELISSKGNWKLE